MKETTAILLFGRSAIAEARHKHFGGVGESQRVTASLLRRTHRVLARTGLPVYQADERVQNGLTFGERLLYAVRDTFARGYENLLVVGSDCPGLSTQLLRTAERQLATGQAVLGPDTRGGVYLLGISRDHVDGTDLSEVRWCTQHVFTDLQDRLVGGNVLPVRADANHLRDLRIHWCRWSGLLGELADLVLRLTPAPVAAGLPRRTLRVRRTDRGRAPPRVA
ncbi:DUF2064 domain-containing protein [Lewinella sp. IMCC34183]|uniref:DUF2064 domain-containing protein n=1 Tax=Lewinella sp. IMCC34183 TaxID=2248762 RepID=UPI001300911A|nr:DUF2064 domain-containing protein [Lewinella sp. IMCC34183]